LALGDHVEHVVARIFVRPQTNEPGATFKKYTLLGAALGSLPLGLYDQEMWEADIIIIPRRRWRGPDPPAIKSGTPNQLLFNGYEEEVNYREVVPVVEGEANAEQKPQKNPEFKTSREQRV
jgi:hypothetical protein